LERYGHPTASLLRKLGAPPARTKAEALRKVLDHPRARAKLQSLDNRENLLANALYKQVVRASAAKWLDENVFRPASVTLGDKSYLDAHRFQHVIAAADCQTLDTDEFCLMVLAFGILQPEVAEAIVAVASHENKRVKRFFELELDVGQRSSPRTQSVFEGLPVAPGALVEDVIVSGQPTAPEAGTTITMPLPSEGRMPRSLQTGRAELQLENNVPRASEEARAELSPEQQNAIIDLQRVLEQYAETSARVRAASSSGAWDELPGLVEHVKALEREGRMRHEHLTTNIGSEKLPWVSTPPSGRDEAIARCDAVAEALRHARRQEALRVEEARRALMGEFEEVGLHIPDALSQATSIDVIRAIQDAAAGEFRLARALKQFLGAADPSPGTIEEFAPATRMEVYYRAARQPQANESAQVIAWLLEDLAAAGTDAQRALELILTEALVRLERNEALPVGTWYLLSRLAPDTWVSRLVASEVPSKLVVAATDSVDLEGLLVTLTPYIRQDGFPDDLRRLVQREAAKNLPLQDRINALDALAKEQPNDRALMLDLLDALAGAGRCSETFLLAVAAARAGVIDMVPHAVHDAVRVILIDAAINGTPQARDLVLLLVVDPEWMIIDADGATLVMFLSWTLGTDELYHRVRYQWPDLFEQAASFRPVLVSELLVPYLDGRDPIGADERRRAAQREALDLLQDFDCELQRQTFFNRWEYAKGYMTLIKERLRADLHRMERGEPLEPVDLETIVRLGIQSGLPEIDGHRAMESMETYMREQWSRLEALAAMCTLLGHSDRESIERVTAPLRDRVAEEGGLPGNESAFMRRIYAHVIEGT
jgi:hypothetical protein